MKRFPNASATKHLPDQAEKAIELEPDNWQAHYNMAIGYIEQGHYTAGKRELKTAFALKKNFLVGFSLVRFFFLRNTIWTAVAVIVCNLLALKLPLKFAVPFMFLIVGYQICAAISCFICQKKGSGVLNLLVAGFLVWFFWYIRTAP